MVLERRVPEILRMVMLAGEEPHPGSGRIFRKGEREGDVSRGSVRARSLPLEEERVKGPDPGAGEPGRIGGGVAAVERQHRKPLAAGEVVAHEGAEAVGTPSPGRDLGFLPRRDEFDERPGQLHDTVLGAPGVPVSGTDPEAHPFIEPSGKVEVTHGDDEMVDSACHSDQPALLDRRGDEALEQRMRREGA
jgi:hypothetical protein